MSPSNVLLSIDGAVKLADFGIAKRIDESQHRQTDPGTLLGKVGYAAPEQLLSTPQDREIDHRVDIYAVGAMLYECLTLRHFLDVDADFLALRRALTAPPPRLLEARDDVPPELEAVYMRAVARDPGERPHSAKVVHDELEAVLIAQGHAATSSELAAWVERLVALKKQRRGQVDRGLAYAETPEPSTNIEGDEVL